MRCGAVLCCEHGSVRMVEWLDVLVQCKNNRCADVAMEGLRMFLYLTGAEG